MQNLRWVQYNESGGIFKEFLDAVVKLIIIFDNRGGGQILLYDWEFPRVTLNGDINMWFMESQEKFIP